MKHQILNRWTGGVVFECDVPEKEHTPPQGAAAYALVEALKSKCNLTGADLSGIWAKDIDFTEASLVGADLTCAVLLGANFTGVHAAGADFSESSLQCANFTNANLANTDFKAAFLEGANFTDAFLLRSRFTCASLENAVFANANLRMGTLLGAELSGACFAGTVWADGVVINKKPVYVSGLPYLVVILDEHMQIGCELHSLAEWSAFSNRRIVAMEGRDALRFWHTYKDALFAMARAAGRSFEPVTNKDE